MKIRKNGKVITLSESDLRRIVKRVMNEGDNPIMNLEFLMCISETLNISITEMGDFKNCISCGTKISNGEIPTEDEIMGCLSELKSKIGEECTGNVIEKGMCIVEKMALVGDCFLKFGIDLPDSGSSRPKLPGYGGGMF